MNDINMFAFLCTRHCIKEYEQLEIEFKCYEEETTMMIQLYQIEVLPTQYLLNYHLFTYLFFSQFRLIKSKRLIQGGHPQFQTNFQGHIQRKI